MPFGDDVQGSPPSVVRPGEERDKILEFYRDKRPRWHPFVATLFWTGMRPGELAALRIADPSQSSRHPEDGHLSGGL